MPKSSCIRLTVPAFLFVASLLFLTVACTGSNGFGRFTQNDTELEVTPLDTNGDGITDSVFVEEIPTSFPDGTPSSTPESTPGDKDKPGDDSNEEEKPSDDMNDEDKDDGTDDSDDDSDDSDDTDDADEDDTCEEPNPDAETVCVTLKVLSYGVSAARISLNCERIFRERDFHNEDYLELNHSTELKIGKNLLTVRLDKLAGSPGDRLVLQLFSCEDEPKLLFEKEYLREGGPPTKDTIVIEP